MNPDYEFSSEKESGEDLCKQLKLMEISRRDLALKMEECKITENSDEEEESIEEEEEEEEFSFAFAGDDAAAIAAEEAFSNGQIKAVFPLFDQSLLFAGEDESEPLHLPMRLPVKKVFVETKEERGSAAAAENTDITGPYCEWSSRKAVEVSPEYGKKSNSTGFSKIWRLKEITCRSNSDGRDAFVFLNDSHAPPPPPPAAEKAVEKKEAAVKKTVKKSVKGKAAAVSPHEVYLKSKAKEEERRRSYLPYRPELLGFFTSTNGGLTRNLHPLLIFLYITVF